GSGGLVLLDMRRQCAQRREDAAVLVVVRTQLEAVALADGQRQLQRVDRVQAEPGIEQRRLGIDRFRRHVVQVEAFDQQLRELALGIGLLRHRYGPSKECWQQVKPAPLSWRPPEPRNPMPAAASLDPAVPALSVDYVAAPGPDGLLAADDVLAVFGFGDPAPAHGGDPRYLRVPLPPHAGPAPYAARPTGRRAAPR